MTSGHHVVHGGQRVHWQRHVPDALRALDALTRHDYADVFAGTAHRPPGRPLDDWIRGLVMGAPPSGRLLMRATVAVQRGVLGLRPERPSRDSVFGWKITGRGTDWLRLEAHSWFMTGELVFRVDGLDLAVATFVRYDRRLAAVIWPPVSLLHRLVGLSMLRYAVRYGI